MKPQTNPFVNLVRALSVDTILDGSVKITQPTTGYRVAIDPILLAAAVPLQNNAKILDVGCGIGTAGLCVLARAQKNNIAIGGLTGVDSQKLLVELAEENKALNKFNVPIQFIHADIAAQNELLQLQSFDHILTNPPYLSAASADPSPDPMKAAANVESSADLKTWIAFCAAHLKPKGTLTMIHRADRLAEIISLLPPPEWNAVIVPLWPKIGVAAKRVIIQAARGQGSQTRVLPGLVLHAEDGSYTAEAQNIIRAVGGLDFNAPPA